MGLVTHENVDPNDELELVGRLIQGPRRSLLPRPRRMWRLWLALKELEFDEFVPSIETCLAGAQMQGGR